MSAPHAPLPTGHDSLRLGLMGVGQRMWDARKQPDRFPGLRGDLVKFCVTELLPHLESDDRWLLQTGHNHEASLLAQAMSAEIRTMKATVYELSNTTGACEAMALTRVLHTFLAAHDHHEKLLTAGSSG